MPAAPDLTSRGTRAAVIRLRSDTFDRRAESMGATSESAKARLVGADRKTLWRYRQGIVPPGLDIAMRWADRLGLTVDELWERVG